MQPNRSNRQTTQWVLTTVPKHGVGGLYSVNEIIDKWRDYPEKYHV